MRKCEQLEVRKPRLRERIGWYGRVAATAGFAAVFEVAPWKRPGEEALASLAVSQALRTIERYDRGSLRCAAEAWSQDQANDRTRALGHMANNVLDTALSAADSAGDPDRAPREPRVEE